MVAVLAHYETTNFRLVQIETVCRQNFKFDENIRKFSKRVENTVKEKLFVTSNFSFSHSVSKSLLSQGCQNVSLCGNGLMLRSNFSFSHSVF